MDPIQPEGSKWRVGRHDRTPRRPASPERHRKDWRQKKGDAEQGDRGTARVLLVGPARPGVPRAKARLGTLPPPVEIALWYYEMGKPKETIDQHLDVSVQHAPETLAKLVRKLSTEQLLELEALVARQEAILDGPRKLLGNVTRNE